MRAEAPPCGGSQNSPRWLRHENISCTTIKTENRLRLAQFYELQKPQNYRNRRKTRPKNNYSLSILSRHYAASGLLNLQTTLTKAVTPVTPGVKLPFQR